MSAPRGWYSRGHLPHFDAGGVHQHITYRLADSLPKDVLARLEVEVDSLDESLRDRERRRRIEAYLDAGHGSCALGHPEAVAVIVANWQHFDGDRYDLLAWVVMPNHCHVLIRPYADQQLGRIVQSWKSFTARRIPRERRAPARQTSLWQREYWDRFIRDERHFAQAIAYIHENPVVAGLCRRAIDWSGSSARLHAELALGAPGRRP